MLRVLIAFASSEGQTEAVAHRLAGRLEAVGCVVRLRELGSERSETATEAWDAAILAGSIHVGQYQPALERFIAAHAEQLRCLPTAFVSVSLSAASRDPAEQAAIRSIAAKLFEKTGWQPDRTAHDRRRVARSARDRLQSGVVPHAVDADDPDPRVPPVRPDGGRGAST